MMRSIAHPLIAVSVIRWLDHHQGAATVVLTAVLIGVTTYYAIQNARMVGEMRRAREVAVLPKLAIELSFLGPMHVAVAVKNVGPGPALDVDVRLIYVPFNPDDPPPDRRWRRNLLGSGEHAEFFPPGGASAGSIDSLSATYSAISLTGSMSDATGVQHVVNETFDDLAEWQHLLVAANMRWVTKPEERLEKAIQEELRRQTRAMSGALDRIAEQLREPNSADKDHRPRAFQWLASRGRWRRSAPPS